MTKVEACTFSNCIHNEAGLCTEKSIVIGGEQGCTSFAPRVKFSKNETLPKPPEPSKDSDFPELEIDPRCDL